MWLAISLPCFYSPADLPLFFFYLFFLFLFFFFLSILHHAILRTCLHCSLPPCWSKLKNIRWKGKEIPSEKRKCTHVVEYFFYRAIWKIWSERRQHKFYNEEASSVDLTTGVISSFLIVWNDINNIIQTDSKYRKKKLNWNYSVN